MSKLDDLNARLKAAKAQYEDQNPVSPARGAREITLGIRAFMEMLGVLLGSGLMGWALDAYFKTAPVMLVIFVVLGIIAAFFNLYKLSKNLGTAVGSNSLQSGEKAARKPSQNESEQRD
jgi:ATP synthase protein I